MSEQERIITIGDLREITDEIGLPAALEQYAEECAEAAQMALKAARIWREENPTPVTLDEALEKLKNEIADCELCVDVLQEALTELRHRGDIKADKLERWSERLKQFGIERAAR